MIYTCSTCAHQTEEYAMPTRKGDIQPGVEKWCYPCKKTQFHYAAVRRNYDTAPEGKQKKLKLRSS